MILDDLKAMNLEKGTPIEVLSNNPNVALPEIFNGSFLTYYRGWTDDPERCCEPVLLHSNSKDVNGKFSRDPFDKKLWEDYGIRLSNITEIRPLKYDM